MAPVIGGLVALFAAASGLLWLSLFGYLLALRSFSRRTRSGSARADWPDVTVVVPTFDEAAWIDGKLDDLRRQDYPGRLRVLVVDGGSRDGTPERVERRDAAGAAPGLLRLAGAPGKAAQINRALREPGAELVVVTDADARLEPGCVRELVAALEDDSRTALVGAAVVPDSLLLEERLHWQFLNYLWWLEGEALSSAVVSGVCYAVRRSAFAPLEDDAHAEDVHLALAASARGWRVRICLRARARELRVPQSAAELLRFRRRRGIVYLRELLRPAPADASARWRLARAVRLLHFRVTPALTALLLPLALLLLLSEHRVWALLGLTGFALSGLAALLAGLGASGDRPGWLHLGLAAGRLLCLTWLALLTLPAFGRRTT